MRTPVIRDRAAQNLMSQMRSPSRVQLSSIVYWPAQSLLHYARNRATLLYIYAKNSFARQWKTSATPAPTVQWMPTESPRPGRPATQQPGRHAVYVHPRVLSRCTRLHTQPMDTYTAQQGPPRNTSLHAQLMPRSGTALPYLAFVTSVERYSPHPAAGRQRLRDGRHSTEIRFSCCCQEKKTTPARQSGWRGPHTPMDTTP